MSAIRWQLTTSAQRTMLIPERQRQIPTPQRQFKRRSSLAPTLTAIRGLKNLYTSLHNLT